MLLKIFTSGPIATHCYLIGCDTTQQAAIIDAPPGVTPSLLKVIEEYKLIPQMVLLTHSHWDHIADAAKLKKTLNIPLYVHALDQENLLHPGSDGLPLWLTIEASSPDKVFKDGDQLKVGTLELEILETPGHTPGGVCLWIKKEKVLFSGDTLFKGSIGNIHFPTSNSSAMWRSLKKLSQLPSETKVYPGHGNPTTIGAESWIANADTMYQK